MTHDFWTRTGGWEFDRSHGDCTSSPSHWQQVEEQAPKPVGWTMCFLLMTLVPVRKLCVKIYIYICTCMCIPCMSSVIGRIYNGSVIQYWRSCTPSIQFNSIQKCLLSHKSCTYKKHKERHSVWTFNQYISSLEAVRNIMLYINITVVQSNYTVLQHIHCIIYHDPWYPSVYACFNYCMTMRIDEAEAYWILNICKIFQSFSFGWNCNLKLQHR